MDLYSNIGLGLLKYEALTKSEPEPLRVYNIFDLNRSRYSIVRLNNPHTTYHTESRPIYSVGKK